MIIRTLLLGTVASIPFSSAVQSADAVVAAAPEQMDYVKVCDAFGTGYFYIPGSETCLKLGGMVRYDVGASIGDATFTTNTMTGRMDISTANETEYGKAYSFFRFDAYSTDNVKTFGAAGYAGIGGFEFGDWDNPWMRFFNYGVGNTWSQGDYANFDESQRQYVSYNAEFGVTRAFISLENDANSNFIPNVSGGIGAVVGDYEGGFGVGYDESSASYALKAVVRGKISGIELGLMGLYASQSNAYLSHQGYGVQFGVGANLTDMATAGATVQYFQDTGATTAIGNVTWNVATGFQTMVEVQYVTDSRIATGFLRLERGF